MLNQSGGNTLQATIENTAGTEFQTIPSANTIMLNAWQHVAVTYNDAGDRKIRFCVNGIETGYQQQPALTGTLASTNDPLIIGNRGANDGGLQGRTDDVRIYNRVLAQTEMTALANLASRLTSVLLNAGGPSYTATDGAYMADTYFSGGLTGSTANPIANTMDDALYPDFDTNRYILPDR